MKRAYRTSQYAKPGEQYCRETYPDEAASILQKAEEYYLVFLKDMPDLGKNMMAKNMLDWFTILAFYEASGHRMDGELLPYLCKTDHYLAEAMHARLIRTQTEALGGDCCDYWYVGDKSPALAPYQDLEQI